MRSIACDMTTKRMIGLIQEEVFEQTRIASALMARSAHPDVVKATVMSAMTLDGARDREMLHKHEGFLPQTKGSTVVFGGATIDARVQTVNAILPPAEESVKRLNDRFAEMETPKALPEPIDAEVDEEEDGEDDKE